MGLQWGYSVPTRGSLLLHLTTWCVSIWAILYAVWGLNLTATAQALARYGMKSLLLLIVAELFVVLANAVRKFLVMYPKLAFRTALCASFYSMAGNNVLPAKAGDVVATVYVAREVGMPVARVLSATLWERLADAQAALVCMVFLAMTFGSLFGSLWIYMGMLCLCWTILTFFYFCPEGTIALLRRIPWRAVRAFVRKGYFAFRRYGTLLGASRLSAGTVLAWGTTVSLFVFAFLEVADLSLSLSQAVSSSFIVILGALIPSSPGGLGVFEASAVIGLGLWGITREEALAIALASHVIIIGTTVSGAIVCFSCSSKDKNNASP